MNINQQKSVAGIEETSARSGRHGAVRGARRIAKRLWREQRGAALLEYGMLGVLVAVFAFAAVKELGLNVDKAMKNLSGTVAQLGGGK